MSQILGVELAPDTAHAIALRPWGFAPLKQLAVSWDPARPGELVAALRTEIGPVRGIGLAVGLGFLHLKQVKLPPLPPEDRRRILTLESDRFFPVQDQVLAISLVSEEDFALAVEAELLERWISAFEAWGPVEGVLAAPIALARALGRRAEGSYRVPAAPGERGLVELKQGRVRLARRMSPPLDVPAAPAPPAPRGMDAEILPALGAAKSMHGPLDGMLLPERTRERIRGRRTRRLATAAAACFCALVLALWSTDRSRERTLERIQAEVAAAEPRASPAIELRSRLATLNGELAAVGGGGASRAEILRVLGTLSARLPDGATVLSLSAKGAEWRIDGTAADAAAVVPSLERDDLLEEVRFLSASSRFREGSRTYETFSIAFRVLPQS